MIDRMKQEENNNQSEGKCDEPRHHKWRNMIKHKKTKRNRRKSGEDMIKQDVNMRKTVEI